MSTVEGLRARIIESGSPLSQQNLSDKRLKNDNEGEKRMQPARKFIKSQIRKVRHESQVHAWEMDMDKESRILQRVLATLNGYEGFNPEVLEHEIGYLSRLGTEVEIIKDSLL